MTKEQIDKAQICLANIKILEDNLNSVTNSTFDGDVRKEEVSNYIHNNCLSLDCLNLLTKEECEEINRTIYNILIKKIKENQNILENI